MQKINCTFFLLKKEKIFNKSLVIEQGAMFPNRKPNNTIVHLFSIKIEISVEKFSPNQKPKIRYNFDRISFNFKFFINFILFYFYNFLTISFVILFIDKKNKEKITSAKIDVTFRLAIY